MAMTWYEMYESAKLDLGFTSPVSWMTEANALHHLSMAQHLIQQETSAVKREATINLATDLNATGQDDLPADMKLLDTITWSPDASTVGFRDVKLKTTDEFKRIVEGFRDPAGQHVALPQDDGALYAMIELRKISFYPYSGATGIVKLRYAPHLYPYTPSNSVEWSGYGSDPTTAMGSNGPEEMLRAAHWGMISYLKAKFIERQPNGLKLRAGEYQIAMAEFRQALTALKQQTLDYTHTTVVPANFGGIQ